MVESIAYLLTYSQLRGESERKSLLSVQTTDEESEVEPLHSAAKVLLALEL